MKFKTDYSILKWVDEIQKEAPKFANTDFQ